MRALRFILGALPVLGAQAATLAAPAHGQVLGQSPSLRNLGCSTSPESCQGTETLLEGSHALLDLLCAGDPASCLDRTPPPTEDEIEAIRQELGK